jgi:hypothetical protein
MLKRRPIDTYIRRATAGLPRLERVDTAAEIRVHLLQKTRELMAQGFPREEAEHLAVQEMGPVAATNRALLGHIFTSSLGWAVVGVMLAGAGVWTYLERDWIFWKDTISGDTSLDSRDLQFAIRQNSSFALSPQVLRIDFYAPRNTQTLEYAIISKHGQFQKTFFAPELFGGTLPFELPTDRMPLRVSLLLGEEQLNAKLGHASRGIFLKTAVMTPTKNTFVQGEFARLTSTYGITTVGRRWTTQKFPNPLNGDVENNQVLLNKWTPIYTLSSLKYDPNVDAIKGGFNMLPDPKSPDGLMIAVRASDIAASKLVPSKLRFAITPDRKIVLSEKEMLNRKIGPFDYQLFQHSDTEPYRFKSGFQVNEVR